MSRDAGSARRSAHKSAESAESAAARLTLAAVFAASGAYFAAVFEDHAPVVAAAWWVGSATVTVAAAVWLGRRSRTMTRPPPVAPLLLALLVAPMIGDGVSRAIGEAGQPLEIVLIGGVAAAALGLAAAGAWATFQPLALIAGLFVTVFAATLGSAPIVGWAAGGFSLASVAWLVTTHWNRLRPRLLKTPSDSVAGTDRSKGRPVWTTAAAVLLVAAPAVAVNAARGDRLWATSGWFPSSGGDDGWYDESARSGVGDGDALVAGLENIQSFGPIEDAPFRSSDEPSLYDLFDDSYDEPIPPKKQ
ncbi:MAG: hypothetical protein ACRC1K_11025, partial [Planctomycetia bacterium]